MKLGIESKTIIVYSLLTVIILIIVGFVSYFVARKNLEKELNNRLIDSAKISVDLIKSYKIRFEPEDEITSEYKTLQQNLRMIKNIGNLSNIRIINNNYDIIIDAMGEESIGTPYILSKYYITELKKSFNGENTVSPVYKGEFGNMLKSAFIPIKDNGKINVVLIAEASPKFLQTLKELNKSMLYSGSIIVAISIIVSLIFIKSLVRPIEDLSKDAQKRAKEMQLIAAGIAHEVRNPLSAISGFTELLNRNTLDLSLKAITDNITSEIKTLNKIVTDFLDFAHPVSLNKQEVNLNQLLEECIEISSIEKDKNINIKKNFDLKFKNMIGDYEKLKQCFLNLIINAKESMKDEKILTINTKYGFDNVRVEIIDTGIGISEEILQNIFLPFFTTKEKGTGIGLSIVKKIVEAHNGKVDVESSLNKGSKFRVVLPL